MLKPGYLSEHGVLNIYVTAAEAGANPKHFADSAKDRLHVLTTSIYDAVDALEDFVKDEEGHQAEHKKNQQKDATIPDRPFGNPVQYAYISKVLAVYNKQTPLPPSVCYRMNRLVNKMLTWKPFDDDVTQLLQTFVKGNRKDCVKLGNEFVEFLGHISKDPVKMSDWNWTTGKLNDAEDQVPELTLDPKEFSKKLVIHMLLNYKDEPYPELRKAFLDLLFELVDQKVASFLDAHARPKKIHLDDVVLDPLASFALQEQATKRKINFKEGTIWLSKANFDKFVDDIVTKITKSKEHFDKIKKLIEKGDAEMEGVQG